MASVCCNSSIQSSLKILTQHRTIAAKLPPQLDLKLSMIGIKGKPPKPLVVKSFPFEKSPSIFPKLLNRFLGQSVVIPLHGPALQPAQFLISKYHVGNFLLKASDFRGTEPF